MAPPRLAPATRLAPPHTDKLPSHTKLSARRPGGAVRCYEVRVVVWARAGSRWSEREGGYRSVGGTGFGSTRVGRSRRWPVCVRRAYVSSNLPSPAPCAPAPSRHLALRPRHATPSRPLWLLHPGTSTLGDPWVTPRSRRVHTCLLQLGCCERSAVPCFFVRVLRLTCDAVNPTLEYPVISKV